MRYLSVIAAVIVLVGVGGFVYWRYFSSTPSLVATQPTTLPSADTTAPSAAPITTNTNPAALAVTKVTSRLTKIAMGPIVPGVVAIDLRPTSSTATSTLAIGADVQVNFIERQSGNIFSYLVRSGTLTRTSNKTLPGIQAASWLPSGAVAFVRYLGDNLTTINTYGIGADGSGGFFLPQGLTEVAVSSTSVLTLATGATGSVASLEGTNGVHKATAFSTPLSALRISFAGARGYFAFARPSQSLTGDLFFVSSAGSFSRVAGPLPGLVALGNHAGTTALVSVASGGVMRLSLVDVATGVSTPLPLGTIADKCVWSADDSSIYCGVPVAPSTEYSYPDDWYQGAVHFSDRIWKIDVKGRFAQLALDPPSASVGALDAVALALNPAATVLVFVNKNDGSLWSYQL